MQLSGYRLIGSAAPSAGSLRISSSARAHWNLAIGETVIPLTLSLHRYYLLKVHRMTVSYFADALSPSLLKRLLNAEGGAAE